MKHFIYFSGLLFIIPIQLIGAAIETIIYALIDILLFWKNLNIFDRCPKSFDLAEKWFKLIYGQEPIN